MSAMQDLRRDSVIEQKAAPEAPKQEQTNKRIIACSVDPTSAGYVINWILANFVRADQDQIVLMHVRPFDMPVAPYVDTTGYITEMQEDRDESHRFLKACATQFWHNGIDCKAVSMMGDPKEELMRKVKDIKADVLIMGARGLGAFKRAFLGSVSDHCVHHAPCAVVIVKHPDAPKSPKSSKSPKSKK